MRTLIPSASATTRWQRLLSQDGVYVELSRPRMVALFALLLVDHYRIVIDRALQSVFY
jgi:hypothetical protein